MSVSLRTVEKQILFLQRLNLNRFGPTRRMFLFTEQQPSEK